MWHEGRWWDEFEAGMLVEEWEERRRERERREDGNVEEEEKGKMEERD